MIKRDVHSYVSESLLQFIEYAKNDLDSPSWDLFYDFIIEAYKVSQSNRYSVSELFQILDNSGIKEASILSVNYAHCLYVLAKYNGKEIYGDDFNV